MENILPEDDLKLIVEHHDSDSVSDHDEHLVVHLRVLGDVVSHTLCGLVVLSAAQLAIVLVKLILLFLELASINFV